MIASILAMILLPLALALLLLWPPLRPLVPRLLGLAPLPALLLLPAAWRSGSNSVAAVGGWTFVLDQPAGQLLAASALLWIIGGLAASRWLAGRSGQGRFALWWLLTLSGSLGIFVAGDVASFYALYALASLPAYGLIAFGGGAVEERAGRITLAAALLGEGLILAAFVLLAIAAAGRGLDIATVMQALPRSPQAGVIIALIVAGFGLKIGLVPLHGWMPLSYAAGPLTATAVLSGATSKAGLIGLIRFLPLDTAMPLAGGLIVAAGLVSAFYGAVLGLTQTNPRSVLAYSSISQLGQMAAVLGAGLAAGLPGAGVAVAFYAAYHVLVKGGLFLMLASGERGHATPRWQIAFAAFFALGFAGLPLSGGALGKLAVKDVAGSGTLGLLLSLAAIGSTVLMLHLLRLWRRGTGGAVPESLAPAWWVAAGVTATLLQWALFSAATGQATSDALNLSDLVKLAWPVAAGGLIAAGLAAAGTQLPRLAPGDLAAVLIGLIERLAARLAGLLAQFESRTRSWPVSSSMLAATLIVFVALLMSRIALT